MNLSGLPTKVQWGGRKRQLTDIQMAHNIFLVSDAFRTVVEQLDPGTHQFAPVELVWKDGSHAASYYWFYPCNRIDSMDPQNTTQTLISGRWSPGTGTLVVDSSVLAGRHIWIDPRTHFGSVFVTEAFKQAMEQAGVKGIGYNEFAST